MERLLITGSNGFVGRNLLEYLKEEFEINTLSARYLANQVFHIESDVIIHLSGKAHDLKQVSDASEYYDANFLLTKQLFDAFLLSDATKFIYVSSVKAVADTTDGILTEDATPNPQTHYGKSKLQAEEYIQSRELPENKFFYILRPCMIHGPGNKGNLNLLFNFVKKGIPYPLAAFDNRRSFLSIKNFCFVVKELLNSNSIPSGVYHLADDEPLQTTEVVSILAVSINKKPNLWFIPSKYIRVLARLGDKIGLPLNTDRLGKLTENYIVSNRKIKKILGKELPLSSRDGLILTARSFGSPTET